MRLDTSHQCQALCSQTRQKGNVADRVVAPQKYVPLTIKCFCRHHVKLYGLDHTLCAMTASLEDSGKAM